MSGLRFRYYLPLRVPAPSALVPVHALEVRARPERVPPRARTNRDVASRDASEPTIRFTVPADRQWRGFVKRLGRPLFLLVVDAEPGTTHPLSTPVTNENLRVQGTRNDRPLIVTATGLRPFGYPSTNQSAAFKFDAVDRRCRPGCRAWCVRADTRPTRS